MTEATTITEGDRVDHNQYGSGIVQKTDISSTYNILVQFNVRGNHIVDRRDLEVIDD